MPVLKFLYYPNIQVNTSILNNVANNVTYKQNSISNSLTIYQGLTFFTIQLLLTNVTINMIFNTS